MTQAEELGDPAHRRKEGWSNAWTRARQAVAQLSRAWNRALIYLHVLWICRVSAASVLLGFLILCVLPQGWDLFADTSQSNVQWVLFLSLAFFLWAFPVHYAARRLLDREDWLERMLPFTRPATSVRWAVRRAYHVPRIWVPRLLGTLCFGAILLGLLRTRANLAPSRSLDQASAAIKHIDGMIWMTVLAAFLFLVLVSRRRTALRLGRRSSLQEPNHFRERSKFLQRSVKHRLGRSEGTPSRERWLEIIALFSMTIVTGIFLGVFIGPFEVSARISLAKFLIFTLGAWVFVVSYLAGLSYRIRAPAVLITLGLLTLIATLSPRFHDATTYALPEDAPARRDRQLDLHVAIERWAKANHCKLGSEEERCPSPIILTGQGGASRASFFTVSVVGHLIDRSRAAGFVGRPFDQQLFAMSTVSGSSHGAVSIRAALLDARLARGPASTASKETVADPQRLPHFAPPCPEPDTKADAFWFGVGERSEARSQAKELRPWRSCLQRLTGGDYLSPVFVGLTFRDWTSVKHNFVGPQPWWRDRTALLEEAWERHYRSVVERPGAQASFTPLGLKRFFGYPFRETDRESGWTPLLFLNGTSAETGRRIIVSDLRPWRCMPSPDAGGKERAPLPLFPESFDLYEVLGSSCRIAKVDPACTVGGTVQADYAPEIRLSNGAAMSARFPVISPAGVLRNRDDVPADRIVDGGYYENDGLVTGADIAKALIAVGLRPVIVRVSNDPVALQARSTMAWQKPRPTIGPTVPGAQAVVWFQTLGIPFQALYKTGEGRGADSATQAVDLVETAGRKELACGKRDCPAHYIHVQVFDTAPIPDVEKPARLPKVSMSWWLSQPVQAYLDRQVDHPGNSCAIDQLLDHLTADPKLKLEGFKKPASC